MQAQELLEIVLDDMPAENAPALLAFLQERGECSRADGNLADAMKEMGACCFIFSRMNLGRELRDFSAHFYFGNGTWEVCLLFFPACRGWSLMAKRHTLHQCARCAGNCLPHSDRAASCAVSNQLLMMTCGFSLLKKALHD